MQGPRHNTDEKRFLLRKWFHKCFSISHCGFSNFCSSPIHHLRCKHITGVFSGLKPDERIGFVPVLTQYQLIQEATFCAGNPYEFLGTAT